jgi:tetratricopeptide (TPR) repeat protein
MTASPELKQALDAFNLGDLDRARALAERGLQQSPSPQLQHLVGLIHCRLGNGEAGVDWLRRASHADPANVPFRVMLVRALVDSGRPAEALEAATPPSGNTPPELALWHARAEAAQATGDIEAAIQSWGSLCKAGVAQWRLWTSYANALSAAGRWAQAAKAFRQAVELNSTDPALRRSFADALVENGQAGEAAEQLLRFVNENGADAEMRILLAGLLANAGRNDESAAQLDLLAEAATGRPFDDSGEGLIAVASVDGAVREYLVLDLARLLERTNRMDALARLLDDAEARGLNRGRFAYPAASAAFRNGKPEEAKRLLEQDDGSVPRMRRHRLMARVADALGDPATAFAEAEAMHGCVADGARWRETALRYIDSVRQVADTADRDWAARVKPLPPSRRGSPVFLVGFPRSGTTLLDTFLMGHPRVFVLEEVPLMAAAQASLGDGSDLPDRPVEDVERARDSYFTGLAPLLPDGFAGTVIDKFPLNMLAPRFIHTLFPGSKFIFAQRHPCDCVLSCFMQPFVLNESMACFLDIRTAADFYDAAMTLWTKCSGLFPLQVHRLAYEELVSDPEAALRPLVDFLGLDWHDELLDHRATAKARGVISTPSYDQVIQPISTSASGRWRRFEKQLEPVLPVLLPWAERLGYGSEQ